MNQVYEDLQAVFNSYDAFDEAACDPLGTTVIKQTLEQMFVIDALHDDNGTDSISPRLADGVHPYLVDPLRFTLESIDVQTFEDAYLISLTAEDPEHSYAYEFEALVHRLGEPALDVRTADIKTGRSEAC